jgi:hypothetical protein
MARGFGRFFKTHRFNYFAAVEDGRTPARSDFKFPAGQPRAAGLGSGNAHIAETGRDYDP